MNSESANNDGGNDQIRPERDRLGNLCKCGGAIASPRLGDRIMYQHLHAIVTIPQGWLASRRGMATVLHIQLNAHSATPAAVCKHAKFLPLISISCCCSSSHTETQQNMRATTHYSEALIQVKYDTHAETLPVYLPPHSLGV